MSGILDGVFLRNKYFILRHGESETNVTGLIISDPAVGTKKYGLTARGREQVTASVRAAKNKDLIDANTIIYCSDFKRAVDTAEITQKILEAGNFTMSPELRERNMGEFNGKLVQGYIEIWPLDRLEKSEQIRKGVEGPESMQARLIQFLNDIDVRYENQTILIISHGDPLSVLQAALVNSNMEQRRTMQYIQPGELRELKTKVRS